MFSKDDPAGCVAIRAFSRNTCEMKRLYVRPDYRRSGIGRQLAHTAINAAREMGYEAIYLDTLPTMAAAVALYKSLGFREISSYYDSPIPSTRFMKLDLTRLPRSGYRPRYTT
jgi:carbonic anhydrase